jgi:hypothetical protein
LIVAAMHGAVLVLRAVGSAFKSRHAIATYMFMALVALFLTEPAASTIFSPQGSWFRPCRTLPQRESHRCPHRGYWTLVALLLPDPPLRNALSYLQAIWPGDQEHQLFRELAAYRSLPFEIGIAASPVLGPYLSARPRYVSIQSASSEGIDTRRLKPGDRVLVTPFDGLEQVVERDPTLTRVYATPRLRVYEVNP